MENTYLVNSADLTSVADAIRTKGETSEQLVFPDGFVTAIDGIKGCAELNFEVVGGETEPENPSENTIWVNTPNEITGWIISADEPSDPIGGVVWLVFSHIGALDFNALSKNAIQLRISSAYQYNSISESWDEKDVKMYIDGDWRLPLSYLYERGDMHSDVTGGWLYAYRDIYDIGTSPSVALRAERANQSDAYNIMSKITYHTSRKINLHGYSKIIATFSAATDFNTTYAGEYGFAIGLTTIELPNGSTGSVDNGMITPGTVFNVAYNHSSENKGDRYELAVPIPENRGDCYIGVWFGSCNCECYSVRLE